MANKKKIFRGFDMQGNRISNVLVDTPALAANPANKGYVDESQNYDTAAVVAQQDSPVMPWAKGLANLGLKQLLDKVLFPTVNPIWNEPVFTNVKLTVLGEYFTKPDIHLLFTSGQKTMRVEYVINPGDRLSGVIANLVITKNDNTTQSFGSTTTSDTNGTINFTFDFTNIKSMVLSKVWQPSTVVKNDNYGQPYKPAEFNTNYTSTFDVFALLQQNNVVSPPIIYKSIASETGYDAGLSAEVDFTTLTGFTTDKRVYLQPNVQNMFLLLIPKELLTSCKFYGILNSGADHALIDEDWLKPSVNGVTDFTLDYFGDQYDYTACTFDFGNYQAQTTIDFQFVLNG